MICVSMNICREYLPTYFILYIFSLALTRPVGSCILRSLGVDIVFDFLCLMFMCLISFGRLPYFYWHLSCDLVFDWCLGSGLVRGYS